MAVASKEVHVEAKAKRCVEDDCDVFSDSDHEYEDVGPGLQNIMEMERQIESLMCVAPLFSYAAK